MSKYNIKSKYVWKNLKEICIGCWQIKYPPKNIKIVWFFFLHFGCGFYCSKSILISNFRLQKYCETIFTGLCLYLHQLKKCLRFLGGKWKYWYFCLTWYHFPPKFPNKNSFSETQKKRPRWNVRQNFVEKLLMFNVAKY